jgi:hypothetical protein
MTDSVESVLPHGKLTARGKGKLVAERQRQWLMQRNAKATHCPEGHKLTTENTVLVGPRKWRVCKTCRVGKISAGKKAKSNR